MPRDMIPIYEGKLKANRVGSFTRGGVTFDVIRPGYDIQGRRRIGWTQIVYKGVPVFEVRKAGTQLDAVLAQFDAQWAKYVAPEPSILQPALAACCKERLNRFMDGSSGEAPAEALTVDGRAPGKQYPA